MTASGAVRIGWAVLREALRSWGGHSEAELSDGLGRNGFPATQPGHHIAANKPAGRQGGTMDLILLDMDIVKLQLAPQSREADAEEVSLSDTTVGGSEAGEAQIPDRCGTQDSESPEHLVQF